MTLSSSFAIDVTLRRDSVPDFDRYPFHLPVVRHLQVLTFHPAVTFIVGENGSGKSTLLEAIAVALGFNAEGGSRNFNFGTRASHSVLHEYIQVARGFRRPRDGYFLRAESFFNVATNIEALDEEPQGGPPVISYHGGRSLHEQSHGESFMALLTHRFGPKGLYVMDEPEAALSPQRQLAVLARIHQLVKQGSQFIIATHSPILMAYPDAKIYSCTADGLRRTDYEDTEHYQVMRDFLANPQRMLEVLLADGKQDSG
ncbi:AAA family ATPase [Pseudoduganella plicata]|uniref:AAA family ATPase n=1 Tax=Pseudoduganella plicata TaxID=321984 RepID=A0A4P7BDX3_9BURK|nr:AAA family ATPase [Pseudoduganella plicata]QBQ36774.1 AAA family ATPase [Pseudoduganella plicata]GGY72847.1 ATPase AAA [Pseudoduganella plicata]